MNATTTITTRNALDAAGADWRSSARCAQTDPELFYPLDLTPYGRAVTAARKVCESCPVRAACLLDVMAGEDPARRWGVTVGFTPDERSALYAAQRLGSAGSGSVAA